MTASILVVDDASMVRVQIRRTLEHHGYAVLEASDGVEALAKLEECPSTRLVVCDVHMPNMNGLEFLERLRAQGSVTPVVMLTAEADPEVIRRAKGLGAKAWIMKPIKSETLVATVARAVAVSEAGPPADG